MLLLLGRWVDRQPPVEVREGFRTGHRVTNGLIDENFEEPKRRLKGKRLWLVSRRWSLGNVREPPPTTVRSKQR